MKNKIIEVENENFILNCIKDDKDKKKYQFGICQFKKKKQIAFTFKLNFIYDCIKNVYSNQCELIFDFDKRTIILFNKDIYYEEKIKKQSLNQFDYENFHRSIPLNIISYHFLYRNIGQHVKFELKRKITEIQNFIEKIPKEESFKELHNEIIKYKDIIDKDLSKYTLKENYNTLDNNISILFEKNKKEYCALIKSIYELIPTYTFKFESSSYKINVKSNEYLSYTSNTTKIAITFSSPLLIHYNDIVISYKSNSDFSIQRINHFQYIYQPSFSFCGLFSSSKNFFGIEKQRSFTYIGYYKEDLYDGIGILYSSSYIYKGNFVKGAKTDSNCSIMLKEGTYEGGIERNELSVKGKFKNESEGITIEGNFKHGEIDGNVRFTFDNGDIYEGVLKNNAKKDIWTYTAKRNRVMKVTINNINNDILYSY